MLKKNLANIITITRIVGTIALIPLETLSKAFFIVYSYCGFSDVLDGFVARTLKTTSRLGSVLDSISDLTFYTVMMLKIMPYLKKLLPKYIWTLIYIVLFVRFLCYVWVKIKENRFESRHTILNKLTGLTMFFLPFVLNNPYFIYYTLLILTIAYVSTADEIFHIIRNSQTKQSDVS